MPTSKVTPRIFIEAICFGCQIVFTPTADRQKYHSQECGSRYRKGSKLRYKKNSVDWDYINVKSNRGINPIKVHDIRWICFSCTHSYKDEKPERCPNCGASSVMFYEE